MIIYVVNLAENLNTPDAHDILYMVPVNTTALSCAAEDVVFACPISLESFCGAQCKSECKLMR